jgi:hypothetical protein
VHAEVSFSKRLIETRASRISSQTRLNYRARPVLARIQVCGMLRDGLAELGRGAGSRAGNLVGLALAARADVNSFRSRSTANAPHEDIGCSPKSEAYRGWETCETVKLASFVG